MKSIHQISERIYSEDSLSKQMNIWRMLSKKTVFVDGVFDGITQAKLNLLQQAAEHGDVLLVGLLGDEQLANDKQTTVQKQDERANIVANLLPVDAVTIFNNNSSIPLIEDLKPDVVVVNPQVDTQQTNAVKNYVESYGGSIVNLVTSS